jgi:membrane protein
VKKSVLPGSVASHEPLRHVREAFSPHFNAFLELLKETANEWVDDKAPRLSASLAFYTLLSLAPLLIIIVAVAALVYGQEAARGQLVWQIQGLVGPRNATTVQGLILSAYKPGAGMIASLLGLLTLAFGASSVVVELRDALNTIWGVAPDPRNTGLASIVWMAKDRFYSVALILGVGFLLLVSLVLNAWIAAMGRYFVFFLPTSEAVLHASTFFISLFIITFLFAAIYKLLPDVYLKWGDVLIGATATSLLFTAGKQLIALYLGKATFGSTYGAASSLAIVLVWVYYSAMLFFLGAEFTKVYTKTCGSHSSNGRPAVSNNPGIAPSLGLPAEAQGITVRAPCRRREDQPQGRVNQGARDHWRPGEGRR